MRVQVGSRRARMAVALSLVVSVSAFGPSGAAAGRRGSQDPPAREPKITILSADDNSRASLAWSRKAFGNKKAETVVLSESDQPGAAYVSGGLQGLLDAPLLLADSLELAGELQEELERLQASSAILLGPRKALSTSIEDQLELAGLATERLAATSLIEQALKTAKKEFKKAKTALVARLSDNAGDTVGSTLAAVPAAADNKIPLLFVDDGLPKELKEFLEGSKIKRVTLLGGTGLISNDTASAIAALGIDTRRLASDDAATLTLKVTQELLLDREPLRYATTLAPPSADDFPCIVVTDADKVRSWASAFPAARFVADNGCGVVASENEKLPPVSKGFLEDGDGTAELVCGPFVELKACAKVALLLGHLPLATVALDRFEVPPQGTLTGLITGEFFEATVHGCELDAQPLGQNDVGIFSLTLPETQDLGVCELVVDITYSDTSTSEQIFEILVTDEAAEASPILDAPELIECSLVALQTAADPAVAEVEFGFDETLGMGAAAATGFHVYGPGGIGYNAHAAVKSGANVTASFSSHELQRASTCTVDHGSVSDVGGVLNPEGALSLVPPPNLGLTDGPDLTSLGNFRLGGPGGQMLADFTFDMAIATQPAPQPAAFALVLADGREARGEAVLDPEGGAFAGGPTVLVRFQPTALPFEAGDVARGIVEAEAVCASNNNCNPTQSYEVTTDGSSIEPDLVSVGILSNTQVEFRFDEPIASNPSPSKFFLYDDRGAITPASGATRAPSTTDVIATYPSNVVFFAISGTIEGGAVIALDSTAGPSGGLNRPDEQPLLGGVGIPGKTPLPDLMFAIVGEDATTQEPFVRYIFDQSVASLTDGFGTDGFGTDEFHLYEFDGTRFTAAGVGCGVEAVIRLVPGNASAVDVYGFTEAQVNASVLGTVDDNQSESAGTNVEGQIPRFPEGDANLRRGALSQSGAPMECSTGGANPTPKPTRPAPGGAGPPP